MPFNRKNSPRPNVCDTVRPFVEDLKKRADEYNVSVSKGPLGCTLIDCGIDSYGSIRAGLRVAEICMGGLGEVRCVSWYHDPGSLGVHVTASHAVLACLGSQYAGWNLSTDGYYALGSGPARAVAQRESLFKEINYKATSNDAVLVLEVDKSPPEALVRKASDNCKVDPKNFTFILTPTTSIVGTVQIVSRVLEVALHKAHMVEFDMNRIIDGVAYAPLPAPAVTTVEGMGRTNDAIIYGGNAHIFIDGTDDEARELSRLLPSDNSRDYGKPFARIYEKFKGDFYAIDGNLFSPARIVVTCLNTGNSFNGGRINAKVISKSFGH